MGHYDHCYEAEEERLRPLREKARQNLLKGLEQDIAERGLNNVLADMLSESHSTIRYHYEYKGSKL